MRKIDAVETAVSLVYSVFTTAEVVDISEFILGDSLGNGHGAKRLRALAKYGLVRPLFQQRPNTPAVWLAEEADE